VKAGLAQRARQWLAGLDSLSLDEIAAQAKQILEDSDTARLILSGCTIALVGPPNTGKSTLLNTLAGREKAIVTEIAGTTRDWVSAEIRIPPLAATVLDTAGLDDALAAGGRIDRAAQQKSLEALDRADLILLVLDASQPVQLPYFGFELRHVSLQLHDDLGLFRASRAVGRRGRQRIVHPSIITRLPGKATITSLHFAQQNPHQTERV
jgi:predicted GTPase